jgi:hypothetical protein
MASLKNRFHSHGKLLAARAAKIDAFTDGAFAGRLGREFGNWLPLAVILAMRADRAVWPAQSFQKFAGFVLVAVFLRQRNQVQIIGVKPSFAFIGGFNVIFHAVNIGDISAFVKYIIPL